MYVRRSPRDSVVLGIELGLDPDQGGPDHAGRRSRRERRSRLGEPVRRPDVDLLAGRRVVRPAGLLRRAAGGRRAAVRRAAHHVRCHRRLGDDARLPRVRRRGRAAGAVPDLAQHVHRPGRRRAERAVRLQHPAALVDRPPVPGGARRRAARAADRVVHHAGRLRAPDADRAERARRRRRVRHVPGGPRDQDLRRGHARRVRRARRAAPTGPAPGRAAAARFWSPGRRPGT